MMAWASKYDDPVVGPSNYVTDRYLMADTAEDMLRGDSDDHELCSLAPYTAH